MTIQEVEAHQKKHGFHAAPEPVMATLPLIVESLERMDFFLDFDPPTATAQHKGAQIIIPKDPGKKPFIHWFTKKETVEAENAIAAQLVRFRPRRPFTGPLRVVTEWTFPWRTTEPKKNRVEGWKWKDTSSDADNLLKTMLDVLQSQQFYLNDSQIADLRVTKQWGDRPGIRVTLEALEPQVDNPAQHKPMDTLSQPILRPAQEDRTFITSGTASGVAKRGTQTQRDRVMKNYVQDSPPQKKNWP